MSNMVDAIYYIDEVTPSVFLLDTETCIGSHWSVTEENGFSLLVGEFDFSNPAEVTASIVNGYLGPIGEQMEQFIRDYSILPQDPPVLH